MNGRKKTLMMTILMLTMPITGCIGGDDDDDEPGAVDISGCTDPLANNYDSSATTDDGTCTYDSTDNNGNNGGSTTVYTGCMDESATNYNPAATEDDGTCEYDDDETSTDFAGISGFDSSSIECGPTGDISIAGSSTVFPVANLWAEAYQKYCNGIAITLEGGGSGAGAGRVCDNSEKGTAVDIGDMSRGWKTSEASVRSDGYTYDCLKGDTSRSAVQISIAADGLSVVVKKGGAAETCISGLPGGGLSVDQARWIWSDYTAAELTASGWDSSALANSDNDDSTHLWSELDASCPASEIKISGADSESGTYEFFMDAMLSDAGNGETFDLNRPDGYTNSAEDEVVVNYLESNADSIGYFGYAYYKANQDKLTAIAIENSDGDYVAPSPHSVADGSYNPLGRFIYMNLHNDAQSLQKTAPFLAFGLSASGAALVENVGYVPMTPTLVTVMLSRAGADGGVDLTSVNCGPTGAISVAGSSTVFPVANLWAEIYQTACDTTLTIEGGGSGAGAGRVCDNSEKGTAVMIGDMSRGWKSSEASVRPNGWVYDCLKGDTSRAAGQFPIAADGLSVVVKKGGAAETCINSMGGLTPDQVRWIYSDFTAAQLAAAGWDTNSLANSDNDDSTHLWSELDASCPASEIKISGADSESGTYEFFMDAMLNGGDGGETFDLQRPDGYTNSAEDEVVVNYLTSNGDSIGYFGYAYYKANQDTLTAVAIMNDAGEYVAPTPSTVADGSYNPLGRFIYMNLHLDSNDLALTLPFLEFGFSSAGDALVNQVGYVPLTAGQDAEMELQRISWMYHTYVWTDAQKDDYWCGSDQTITVAGSSTVFPVMNGWGDEYSGTDGLCPGYTLTIEGGGSGAGAGRVCDNSEKGTKVMIGDMSRGWKAEEATSYGNGVYHCLKGDTSIQVTQLPVGLDGLSVVVKKGGAADTCVSGMGGLTVDQVRWIYSDYTAAELVATGWDSNSLANSDGDDSTHLWSELDASCPASEIKIAGADSESGTYEFFGDAMFADKDAGGETFDLNRPDGYTNSAQDEVVVNYLESNGDAIGYFGYAYYVAEQDKLSALPIQNSAGNFVAPNAETIADGSYNPLTRAIYINVNHEYMDEVYNYLRYAFSALGDVVVNSVGYVPLSGSSSAWQDTWMRVEAVINNS